METVNHEDMETWWNRGMETWRHGDIKRKTEAQSIFLNLFTICSSYKRKFVVFLVIEEGTNGSYPFANGLNGLYELARQCFFVQVRYSNNIRACNNPNYFILHSDKNSLIRWYVLQNNLFSISVFPCSISLLYFPLISSLFLIFSPDNQMTV
jgi:hypothetical protein